MLPFSKTLYGNFDARSKDDTALTWHHLARMTMESMGGEAKLSDLYDALESHPKAQKNPHYRDRIRATIHEHKGQYVPCGERAYALSYTVA